MAKIKNRILIILALVMLCAVGVFALAACNNTETYTVTFMVRENGTTGDWQQYTTVDTNDDGSVTLPAEPTVDGYTFRDWYTDEACSADNVFDETSVSGDITVYALMAEANITLNIMDGSGTASQVAGTLSALSETTAEQEAAAAEDNLTFDGWYTDAAFTQKYSDGMDATALYGRYMAAVTIDDGYATVYTALVTPGTAMSEPTDDDVLQYYMGEIVYYTLVDSEGNILSRDDNGAAAEFDFSTEIETNTSLRVMWASPYINYDLNSSTGGLVMQGFKSADERGDMDTYPVISIPAYVTLDGETTARLVESVIWDSNIEDICPAATKIIFADGIKSISGVMGNLAGVTAVEEIVLPDTLKIIDTAFWNLSSIKNFDMPDGVEIIINSFWMGMTGQDLPAKTEYSFEIEIPSSVKYLSQVPSNFKYAENSDFWYDEVTNAIYKKGDGNNYETLISMYDFGSAANVKEGVAYVQVGAFAGMDFDYLYLPSTFINVAYIADADDDDYPYYTGGVGDNGYSTGGFRLYRAEGGTTRYGLAIVDRLDIMERVVFDLPERPTALQNDAIQGKANGNYSSFTALVFDDEDKVVFTGEIADGESVTVRVRAIYEVNGEYNTYSVSGIVSGGKLTKQAILDAIGFDNAASVVVSITQFGDEYFASAPEAENGKTITCRQYIEVVYSDNPGGAVIELVDGVMTVTDFDETTAILDENGGYIVTIPAMYEGVAVTAIADGAFKDVDSIVTVFIPKSVTTIGAEAFMNTVNLTTVTIAPGGLSVIGRSAFENSGFTTIALPLANLTDVQPYAFKSEKLQSFTAVEGEKDLCIGAGSLAGYASMMNQFDLSSDSLSKIAEGTYLFVADMYGNCTGLVRFKSFIINDDENTTTTYVDYVAIAGGMTASQVGLGLDMGMGYKVYYELLEGSIYYLKSVGKNQSDGGIIFGLVTKVHANAFTDMDESIMVESETATKMKIRYAANKGASADMFKNETIFENGWFDGKSYGDEGMTFLDHVTDYSGSLI